MNEPFKVLSTTRIGNQDFPIYGSVETPLFKVSDVANVLEHSNPRAMIQSVDEEEKVVSNAYTLGGVQDVTFLTEDGLYEVFFLSRKPIAKQFKKVVKSILKELRTKGEVRVAKTAKQVSASAAKAAMIFIKGAKDMLRLSDASVAAMYNKAAETYDLPVAIDYVPSNGNLVTSSFIATQLNISANALNKRLAAAGLIERKTRQSHKGEKHFWCLTDKGLAYGENQVNPKNPNETFPKFYEKSAGDIINLIKN